jgi:tripartite-type tricarboxylate transporter receptor subunit TctC
MNEPRVYPRIKNLTMMRTRLLSILLAFGLCAGVAGTGAQTKPAEPRANFPTKPLRIVVPYAPGGGLDILARMIAQPLSERWRMPVIADNRPGASGMVGTQIVAKAAPDGYTLAMVSTEFITAPLVYKQFLYDTIKDFTGVVQTATQSYLLVIHPSLPVQSVRELIALSKTRSLNYTSAGLGGVGHLSGELLKRLTGMRMVYVNYKGTGPALTDTIAGEIQVMFVNPLPAVPHVKSGRLRLLASTDATRIASMPDVPTLAESGVPGFSTSGWNGLIAPAGTPMHAVRAINLAVAAIIKSPYGMERITSGGAEPAGGTPEALSALMLADHKRWSEIIRTMKIGGE